MAESDLKKLFLLDGMALVYRAHFAFSAKPIITSQGLNTSAVYGFTSTLLELIRTQKPTHMAVVFDSEGPTQRHADFSDYKAQREAMPEDLSKALPYVRRMIEALRIPTIILSGYEADDIIGTLAVRAQKENFVTYMVTPDKDFGQLVSDKIYIYKPSRMGDGVEILGVPEIKKKWGIERIEQVIDILGLWGDTSDNIPGVPGIGEKTAQKLIAQYGNVESILEKTGELKGKLKESLESNREQALLSKKLATILLDVPLDISFDNLVRKEMDRTLVEALCAELEFKTLRRRLLGDGGDSAQEEKLELSSKKLETENLEIPFTGINAPLLSIKDVEHRYHTLSDKSARAEFIDRLKKLSSFCFDLETTSLDFKTCSIVGIAFSFQSHEGFYVPFPAEPEGVQAVLEEFRPLFENQKIEKVGHHLKFDVSVLRWHGIKVEGKYFDTMLAHAVLEPEQRHNMDYLSEVYLGYAPVPISRLIGENKKEQISMRDVPLTLISEYAAEDADVTWQLRQKLEPLLKERKLERVFYEIECPLVRVLVEMEVEGVAISPEVLKEFSIHLEKQILGLEKDIFSEAGVSFNLNSPKQLGDILFNKLQLVPKAKKTKTGQYATDEQTLVLLSAQHIIVQKILNFREATKLKSTYVDALPESISPRTGRIHTTFNQMITTTGRLNSQDPNLQNIPIRTEQGREIRKAFIVDKPEFTLLTADYSQIELRIIAALSGDAGMQEAFQNGVDIHQATAAKVYNVSLENVTSEMRRKAKMVNFGIIYGISAFGLAQRLGIPRGEAASIIEAYFEKYPEVKKYMTDTVAFARSHGYVETVTGRRRYLRDINSANATIRNAAERNAINAPIQGTAADMIKIAMVRIHQALDEKKLATKMILQVHDELVFEMKLDEKDKVIPLVIEKMRTALPELKVPIVVEVGTGAHWLEAHP